MLRNWLEGKPFRYPLHTFLVHFPIGLFVLSFLLDLGSWVWPNPAVVQAAAYAMLGGLIMGVLAAAPGLADWSDIRVDHPARRIATQHLVLNLAAVAAYAVNYFFLRAGLPLAASTPGWPVVFSVVGLGLISVSGYLGGRLVYAEGIGVGRHRRWTETPLETITGLGQPDRARVLAVGAVAEVAEGGTLRADVAGDVVTVVRWQGTFYAFQEFCTHRFGPLSEGVVRAGQIECPWHRSCFDVRTGQVTQGPAKLPLKTYRVSVSDDMIYVHWPGDEAQARRGAAASPGQGRQPQSVPVAGQR